MLRISLVRPLVRIAPLAGLLAVAWVVMTITHECGHLIGGALGGAVLTDLDLAPWRMPYSLHCPDPHPLLTLWAGPLIGVLAPVAVAWLVRHHAVWFIADFCVLANGVYLALAWLAGDRWLDSARLLAAGTPPLCLGLFCAVTIGVGYFRFRSACARVWASGKDGVPPATRSSTPC